jgi:hypothetical protein
VDHKKQHWIPQSYLSAWCDPNTPPGQRPYVWVLPKDGSRPFRKSPKNLFEESELYTVTSQDGTRDLRIEKSLSEVEGRFATIRRELLDRRLPIGEEDRAILSTFACAMLVRTPKHREHARKLWEELRCKGDLINSLPESQRRRFASLSINTSATFIDAEVGEVARRPMQNLFEPSVYALLEIVSSMSLAILETTDGQEFLTSDAPVWIADPDIASLPPQHRGLTLAAPRAEMNLPISPLQCLHFNRRELTGYIGIPASVVSECNREVMAWAHEGTVQTRESDPKASL